MCDLWILSALLLLNKRPHMAHSVVVEADGVGNRRCTGVSGCKTKHCTNLYCGATLSTTFSFFGQMAGQARTILSTVQPI